ncbi:MAG TPA: GFA family protein, partial [Verrucomicrobiae bacterium]|nr:GFA family protein [Verrucomicrobiae bacterium]
LSFAYHTPEARFYVTIGSLDAPERVPIEIQFGIESRLPWVKFCEDVKSERTGESDSAQAFFANMQVNQSS